MTRRNSHRNSHQDEEPDASFMLCCIEVGCHNPFEGCCDAIMGCIRACCKPVTDCITSVCEGFAFIWYTFAWILEYVCTLAYLGMFGFICYYAFSCTGTTFSCPDGKCTASGKEPLEDVWTPEMIDKLVTAGAFVGVLFTAVYTLGIPAGYFDQPFDKSNLKIEHTLWASCQHVLKYMFVLPIVATGFNYNPQELLTSKYGNFMMMCYNDQVGKFLWGMLDVQGMSQFGSFVFVALIAILLSMFCMMSCSKKATFLCMECTCFSPGCYYWLCWVANGVIWIGAPLAIVSGVSAFFMTFFSYSNAVLALMAAADFGYFLQWICAFAAPEGSYAHRMYVQQQKNLQTGNSGSGSENRSLNGRGSTRTSTGRISTRDAGGRPSRNGPTQTRKRRGQKYEQARKEEEEDPYSVEVCVDEPEERVTDEEDPDQPNNGGYESGSAGGGVNINCENALETVNNFVDGAMSAAEQYGPDAIKALNKLEKYTQDEEEGDNPEAPEEQDGNQDEPVDDAGGDENSGGWLNQE